MKRSTSGGRNHEARAARLLADVKAIASRDGRARMIRLQAIDVVVPALVANARENHDLTRILNRGRDERALPRPTDSRHRVVTKFQYARHVLFPRRQCLHAHN